MDKETEELLKKKLAQPDYMKEWADGIMTAISIFIAIAIALGWFIWKIVWGDSNGRISKKYSEEKFGVAHFEFETNKSVVSETGYYSHFLCEQLIKENSLMSFGVMKKRH